MRSRSRWNSVRTGESFSSRGPFAVDAPGRPRVQPFLPFFQFEPDRFHGLDRRSGQQNESSVTCRGQPQPQVASHRQPVHFSIRHSRSRSDCQEIAVVDSFPVVGEHVADRPVETLARDDGAVGLDGQVVFPGGALLDSQVEFDRVEFAVTGGRVPGQLHVLFAGLVSKGGQDRNQLLFGESERLVPRTSGVDDRIDGERADSQPVQKRNQAGHAGGVLAGDRRIRDRVDGMGHAIADSLNGLAGRSRS